MSNSSETRYRKSRNRFDGGLAVGELCTHLFERLPARHGYEGLQRFVDRGQEIMQQTGMREQRLCCLGVRSGSGRLRRKPVDPFLERLDGVR